MQMTVEKVASKIRGIPRWRRNLFLAGVCSAWIVFGLYLLLDHLKIDSPILPYFYFAFFPAAIQAWESDVTSAAGNAALLIYLSLLNGVIYVVCVLVIQEFVRGVRRRFTKLQADVPR